MFISMTRFLLKNEWWKWTYRVGDKKRNQKQIIYILKFIKVGDAIFSGICN